MATKKDLVLIPVSELAPALAQSIETITGPDYTWFNPVNQREFIDYLEPLDIAHQKGFKSQVMDQLQRVGDAWGKDRVDRIIAFLSERLNYRGACFHYPWHNLTGNFDEWTDWEGQHPYCEWDFTPIKDFQGRISRNALRTMKLLEQEGILPTNQEYWVVEPEESEVDPLLCARFGNWFVVVADWL